MNLVMKKISVIVIRACLLLACAACQGEPGTAEPSSDGSAVEPVLQEASSEPTQTRPTSTETVSQSAAPSVRAPDSTPTQGTAQAVTLLSAKQAQAVDCVVYRANVSMTPDKQAGKTHELKTREEMNPVLAAVQQKVWTPTGESWEVKMNPSLPLYTLLLQVNGNTQLELGLCGDLERAGYVAVKKDGKMTCYEVPVAAYRQLVKAYTFV